MIYAEYLSTAEMHRWILDTDIDWDRIDSALALAQTDLLDRVRDSALIESFFPLFTPRALEVLWDDVAATAVFSIQLYESYKHFHVFNQYLARVGYRPVEDEEIIAVRRRNQNLRYHDGTELLTRYMMSEHFAAHHFFKDSRQAREPVLAEILQLVGRDEVRHAQFAYDLLDRRIRNRPDETAKVLKAAREFRHLGLEVLPYVPVAEKNDFAAIVTLNQKLVRLTGQGLAAADWRPT
ncbi:MAG: ferritin-like domain-containing protein [Candidatus Saccharimonas sp.]|nr:ferritin-like domain-containing protein [Planctomycetaceae bacterium]